jgi:hypothetical protein
MMKRLALVIALMLSACGGGGGGGDGSWLEVGPPSMNLEFYQGDPAEFSISATQVGDVDPGDGNLFIGIVQSADVLRPGYEVVPVTNADWVADLHLREDLAPGVYTGTFELRLCHDQDILTCAHPWPGSPWVIPYTFTIHQGLDLRTLTPLSGAGPWSTFGGNLAHTGYVSAPALAKADLDRRWGWTSGGEITGVATDAGRVFVVVKGTGQSFSYPFTLYAIRESDGQVDWSTDLGSWYDVSAPAVGGGKVYLAQNDYYGGVFVYDQATGEALGDVTFTSDSAKWGAPAVDRGTVYSQAGTQDGVVSYAPGTDSVNWFKSTGFWRNDTWSPAVDGTYVYGLEGSTLVVLLASDGSTVATVSDNDPLNWWWGTGGGVVLGPGGTAYTTYIDGSNDQSVAGGRLVSYAVGTANPTRRWSVAGTFRSAPVLANGVLYIVNGDALEARSPATGARSWSWSPPSGLSAETNLPRSLAVVGNKAIVDGGWWTYIVDLGTHQTDYIYPAYGPIAVSENGIAYISGRNGALIALNLH